MSDTQESLSKIRENYEKIRNNMESNDLNDIIADSSDELFAGLKEIVFSKKNTINIQNDIRRIARNLEDKHKRLKKDDDKYLQETNDIDTEIRAKNTEITTKEDEIRKNKQEAANTEAEIQTKNQEKDNYEKEKKDKKGEQDIEKGKLQQKNKEIILDTGNANNIGKMISKSKTDIQHIENDIEKKKNEIIKTENNIRNKQRDISTLENRTKNKENEKTKIEKKKNEANNRLNQAKNDIEKEKIETEIEEIEKKENNIQTEIEGIEIDKKKIEDEIETFKKNIKKTEIDIENSNQKIETEKNNLTKITNDLTAKEAEIYKQQTEKIQIESNIDILETGKSNASTEYNEKKSEIDKLNNEIEKRKKGNEGLEREIKGIESEIKTLNNKLKEVQEKQQANQDNIDSIEKVMQTHKEIAQKSDLFDTDKDLKEQKIKLNTSANASIMDGFLRDINQRPYPLEFELYDGENKKVSGNKIKNIKLKDGTVVNIEGITINNNGEIIRDNVKLIDTTTNKTVDDFPIEFELEIGAKTIFTGSLQQNTPNRDIAITNKKILKIKIDVDHLDQDKRKAEINTYNNSGNGHTIEQSLEANHDILIARLEREAFYRGLEKADGPKFNKLTAEQKEDLYQEVRNKYRTGALPRAANLANMNNFNTGANSFVERFSGEKHESNKPEFTKNAIAYRDYIHNNLEEQIKKYFEWRFDEVFSKNTDGNTYLKSQLTNYLSDIEHQKVDNDVHQNILGDIDAVDEMENRRRMSVDINGRTYGIGRRDVNYLRFLQDSKVDVKDQIVNITTNNRPEDLNNPEPVKYDMHMEVSGKQQLAVNIKIDKQKEIKLKAGDPAAMVRRILQCEDIQHGKVRAHVVYNVIKGFIKAAKQKDISLTYRDPGTGDMMIIKMDGDNIVLEQQDNQANHGGTYRRNTTVLFDHQYFENTNTFDSTRGNENRRLRVGIDRLMGHFNFAMNELHYQYRQATERKWMGLRRGETRMTLPTSIFLSPIKKILNIGKTTNFDFSTTVQSNGKSISIDFKKNKFTFNMDGLKKPISSRTLGKLLRHREGGIRVFDGMERDIAGKIYEEVVKKMRENTKVARTNFGVKDYITGRTYILDSDGQIGYISAEQAAEDQNMIRKGRLNGREYGVVNNPPAGRTMCDESETREVMKNPFLMGRLIKTMNNRMGIISGTRSLLS